MCQVYHADQERKEGSQVYPATGGLGQFPLASSRWFHERAGGGGDDARARGGVHACGHGRVPAHDHARVSDLRRVHNYGGQGEYPGLVYGCGLGHGANGHGHDHGCARESVHDRGLYHGPHHAHGCGGGHDLYRDRGRACPHACDHVCGQHCDHDHA